MADLQRQSVQVQLSDVSIEVVRHDGAVVLSGPFGTDVAMTERAARETLRNLKAALEDRGAGAPLRDLD